MFGKRPVLAFPLPPGEGAGRHRLSSLRDAKENGGTVDAETFFEALERDG